jgi:penicillin amidase
MNFPAKELLRRLGEGWPISSVCAASGMARSEFDARWRAEIASRIPETVGTRRATIRGPVRIERDPWGIPHVFADNDEDLFFGFGYAMAQDRLFQLDVLRRRGSGRLSEVLGTGGANLDQLARIPGLTSVFELDLLVRTVGIRRIAEAEWDRLPAEGRALVTAFAAGVNALMDETRDRPPIEFDLLDYRPEPWSPLDCLTIEVDFAWYLTGRFPVIVLPELARRTVGDGPLFQAFLEREADEESILPPGSYPLGRVGTQPIGTAVGDPQAAEGSNNWVVAGTRTPTGKPMLASDPHIAFEAVSCWYEVHLCGGSFDVAGMAYAGMPAVMFGRNPHVAWGCTNNICSQRDLYQERTDPAHPGCFLFDGRWEPARERRETIAVKGRGPVEKTIRSSRNGPLVDEVLPPPARGTGPVALKWLGSHRVGWLPALLALNRARSAEEFREALRPWHVPVFSVVFADGEGHVGYQAAGRVPIRKHAERGYRPGWDPEHQWEGLVPFEGMPRLADPERGWIATANNRPAPDDFPYPLSGTWSDSLRADRIRQMIEAKSPLFLDDFVAMQYDALSLRAKRSLPHLLKPLSTSRVPGVREAVKHLEAWDGRMEVDSVGATIFAVFFAHWMRAVVAERFDGDTAALLSGGGAGVAAALLREDRAGWFKAGNREPAIETAFRGALDCLGERLGNEMSQWTWSRLHVLPLRHVLSGRGDLGELLDHGGQPVKSDSTTVCCTGTGPAFEARTGAGYRMVVDLSESPPGLWAVDAQSQSGHPGSLHYADQLPDWLKGRYHFLALGRDAPSRWVVSKLTLQPG